MKLDDLIKKHSDNFSTYYSGELYSHTPMALISLYEMGANDERLDEYFNKDVKKLSPLKESSLQINEDNWKDFLGNYKEETPYVSFFHEEIKKIGQKETLRKYFDELMPGVGAAAFHPIIRLSYAVKRNDDNEVAISLGTWAASYLDLGLNSEIEESKTVLDNLKAFQEKNFNNGERILTDTIAERMTVVSESKEYNDLSASIVFNDLEEKKLETYLLWLFAQTNNFTLLHAITSHDAYESLKQFSLDERSSRIYYWKAILTAYLSTTGVSTIDLDWKYPDKELDSWGKIKKLAIQNDDNHVVKLVHVLSNKNRPDLDYELRYAATLKLGLF